MAFETINLGNQPTGSGGDTARSAFEKVNKNFINAEVLASSMSQAQFEAIRAQNNEEYAASGFVHFGDDAGIAATIDNINNGLATLASASFNTTHSNKLWLGREDSFGRNVSKTNNPVVNISGVIYNILTTNGSPDPFDGCSAVIKFPQSPDGKTTYNKSTGANIVYATTTAAFNAAAVDVNLEVVTDRVDMWGFESFLEEVSLTNPYIYPNGLIQSLATTMDGIATVVSNRPVTYYAVFDGDTGSKGKGLNYFALSDANKKKVLANSKNNLYYLDDGRLVQWRLRQRTIAGAGNGDWSQYDVSTTMSTLLSFSSTSEGVKPQGISNTKVDTLRNQYFSSVPANAAVLHNDSLNLTGLYSVRNHEDAIATNIEGKCYFLVCGTVNRLNQGAYHPSFNPSGTASWRSAQQAYWPCTWDNKDIRTKLSGEPTNKASCFTATLGTPNGGFGNIGTLPYDGYNRPDKRFYDAIYADGQGGVCRDMRYSAYGIDSVDFAEADQRVKNGTYRGFEGVKFTRVIQTTNINPSNQFIDFPTSGLGISIGNTIYIEISAGVYRKDMVVAIDTNFIKVELGAGIINCKVVLEVKLAFSVGGSFLQTDVIGNPANILATPALANGWQGSWVPVIPDGTSKAFPRTRKALSVIVRVYTTNNGSSWATSAQAAVADSNLIANGTIAANEVDIVQYLAFAKQTENAVNAVVYGGAEGVGDVYYASWGDKANALFAEGCLGLLLTNSATGTTRYLTGTAQTTNKYIYVDGRLLSSGYFTPTSHTAVSLGAPVNNSPAFKALDYNVSINQQAFKQYVATELKHDGTDWGDDSRIHIVDNENVLTDLNGNTVKVVTHKLKEPIGWIKNTI